ncbi:MAG: DUF5011 domain-containing protein [Candidatus Latescibacteria bacterium]|nr:DUF5011 domain-containing protein [Candidatus Latescibacterota bacterium]
MNSRRSSFIRLTMASFLMVLCFGVGPTFAQTAVPGVFDNALSFDGDDYLEYPHIDAYNTQSFTIEAWVRVDGLIGNQYIVRKPGEMEIWIDDQGRVQYKVYYFRRSGPKSWTTHTIFHNYPPFTVSHVEPGTWHHIAVNFSKFGKGATTNMFLDGNRYQNGRSNCDRRRDSSSPLYIGEGLVGQIDEVRFWNYTYFDMAATTRNQTLVGDETGLIGYWNMDNEPDRSPPVITLNDPEKLEYGLGLGNYVELGAVAIDNLDSNVIVAVSGSVNTDVAGDYTITYTATDVAGNTGTATRIVQVTMEAQVDAILGYLVRHVDLQRVFGTNFDAALQHWQSDGSAEGRNIAALDVCGDTGGIAELTNHPFDPCWYLNNHPDLTQASGSGNLREVYEHWIVYGLREGRQSNANFSISAYRDRHPDLQDHSYGDALGHWLSDGQGEGRDASPVKQTNVFDPVWYMVKHEMIGQSRQWATDHWLQYGINEGRQSNAEFSISAYRDRHPDLHGLSYGDALGHWFSFGQAEERDASPVGPDEAFDPVWYATNHPDLVGMNILEATQHWLDHGLGEGRQSNANFSIASYLNRHDDLVQDFGATNYVDAYKHWVEFGQAEGRDASP